MISTNLCAENAPFSQTEKTLPLQPDRAANQSAVGSPIGAAGLPSLESPESEATGRVDERESLVNDCETGPIEEVALPLGRITQLHGIMLDFDLHLLNEAAFPPGALDRPETFFEQGLKPMLDREEVYRSAEVRVSGRGLHAIVRLDPSIEFRTDTDRKRWAAHVQVVQLLLPTDLRCPGITALTRPLGSINGKNRKVVRSLKEGRPVSPKVVSELVERAQRTRFETVCQLLCGSRIVRPCPRCKRPDSQLLANVRTGTCYHCKSKLQISDLFRTLFKKPDSHEDGGQEGDHE